VFLSYLRKAYALLSSTLSRPFGEARLFQDGDSVLLPAWAMTLPGDDVFGKQHASAAAIELRPL
jgi:hypothetical protein